MISFIVCSVRPEMLAAFRSNIEQTVGVPYEIVAVENLTAGYSLCQAYNIGAARAQYPYLCFAHEDIAFKTANWGGEIADKLAQLTTGVIGFAGGHYKPLTLTTWAPFRDLSRINVIEKVDSSTIHHLFNPKAERYGQVIVLDGLCLFVRADVWREVRFDEVRFDGFHLYDLDFSTAVHAAGYKNYVAFTLDVVHFSKGSFNEKWYHYSKIYHQKWLSHLPLSVQQVSDRVQIGIESEAERRTTYMLLRRSVVDPKELRPRVLTYLKKYPHRLLIIFRYLQCKKRWSKQKK